MTFWDTVWKRSMKNGYCVTVITSKLKALWAHPEIKRLDVRKTRRRGFARSPLDFKRWLATGDSLIRETEFVKQAPRNRTVTLDLSSTLFIGYCHSAMHQLKLYWHIKHAKKIRKQILCLEGGWKVKLNSLQNQTLKQKRIIPEINKYSYKNLWNLSLHKENARELPP